MTGYGRIGQRMLGARRRTPAERRIAAAAVLAFWIHGWQPSTAAADSAASGDASQLFREGRQLMSEGRHAEACDRFERSLGLERAIGTQFNLANCWEQTGKTASARKLFEQVASAAETNGQPERARVARDRADALTGKLSHIALVPDKVVPELRIESNGEAIESRRWGIPLPVDPGPYEIRAMAPGKSPFTVRITVGADSSFVRVSIPELRDAAAQAGACPRSARRAPSDTALAARPDRTKPSSANAVGSAPTRSFGPVPFGLSALGIAGAAVGSVFLIKYRSSNADAESICARGPCSRADVNRHEELTDRARAARTGAYLSFGVGAAALVGAAVTYFGVPAKGREQSARVHAGYAPDGTVSIAAEARF